MDYAEKQEVCHKSFIPSRKIHKVNITLDGISFAVIAWAVPAGTI